MFSVESCSHLSRGESSIGRLRVTSYPQHWVNDTDNKHCFLSCIKNNLDTTDAVVTVHDTICAIKGLRNNKSPGYDGFMSEHLKYASHLVHVLVVIIKQTKIKHGSPLNDLITMCVPFLKNKNGDTASKPNLSTVASEMLQKIHLIYVDKHNGATENQFAYKKGHSSDMCIFTLKECISCYTVHNTPMYVCFLGANKVFDCIDRWNFLKNLW